VDSTEVLHVRAVDGDTHWQSLGRDSHKTRKRSCR